MFKACGTAIAQLLALVIVFFFALRDRFEPPADWLAAGVMGFGAHLVVGMIITAWRRGAEGRLVARAMRGQVPRDGQRVAVLGTIDSIGAPLTAPFTGQPVVGYIYSVYSRIRSGKDMHAKDVAIFSGFGLGPAAIRANIGNVRLLGFPTLVEFPEDDDFELENAQTWLSKRPWKRIKGLNTFTEVERLVEDSDGVVCEDFRMTDRDDHQGLYMTEQRIEPGTQVCAIGRWSVAKNGLVPSAVGSGEALKLLRVEDGKAALRSLRASRSLLLIGAVLTVLFIHGGGWLMLTTRERESEVVSSKERRWWSAIEENRVSDMRRITKRLPVDYRDGEERTALMYAKSPEMVAALLALGADPNAKSETGQTPLMRTSWTVDDPEIARLLLAAGADINAQDRSGDTPLSWALMRAHQKNVDFLRSRGGQ